jgi:ATP phosphoribosyltransferase
VGADEPDAAAIYLARVLKSVVDARGMRYLMMNAPQAAVDRLSELVPGGRAPSVLPLSEPGMVAVHALVPAAEVWRVLPELEAVGASSILLVPVERMLG